jgi:hypothetical protein
MPEDTGVTRIAEVRGKDGSVAYEVSGGKHGEGEASFYMPREAMHAYEKEHGKKEFQEMLKRGIESSIQSRKENLDPRP